jgi:hypothetical protein
VKRCKRITQTDTWMMELEASRHSKTASTSPNVTVNQMSSRVCSVKTHFIYQKIMYHCDQYMKLFPQRTNRDIITYMNCKENNVTNFKCYKDNCNYSSPLRWQEKLHICQNEKEGELECIANNTLQGFPDNVSHNVYLPNQIQLV